MKHLVDVINEGVFDMGVNTDSILDKISTEDILDKCKGKFKTLYLKDGSVKITGKLIISKDTKGLYIKCKEFKGHLTIDNCPELTSLEDTFLSKMFIFKGSISINNCPKLTSLNGLPAMIEGDLNITNCKKVKDLGTCESVFGDIWWMNNGKKLSKEQLLVTTNCIGNVMLESVELNESVEVNESLSNPWLQKLAKQIKEYSNNKQNINAFIQQYGKGYQGSMIDQLDAGDITVYDLKSASDKKELSDEVFKTYSSKKVGWDDMFDMLLMFDSSLNVFVYGYGSTAYHQKARYYNGQGIIKVVKKFFIPRKDYNMDTNWMKDESVQISDIKYDIEHANPNYKCIMIKSSPEHSSYTRAKIQGNRKESREGMITPGDAKQYKEIAKANVKRYKEIIARNRSMGNIEEYNKLAKMVEDILNRCTKLSMAVFKEPDKYQSYKISNIFTKLRDAERYDKGNRYGEDGLIMKWQNFVNKYQDIHSKDYYGYGDPKDKLNSLNKMKDKLIEYINRIDADLKSLGF